MAVQLNIQNCFLNNYGQNGIQVSYHIPQVHGYSVPYMHRPLPLDSDLLNIQARNFVRKIKYCFKPSCIFSLPTIL